MTTTGYTWELVRGDDSTRIFEYKTAAGTVIPLTGYTANCEFNIAGTPAIIAGVVNGAAGSVTVGIPNATSVGWGGDGDFKLRLTAPTTGLKTTIVYGPVKVIQ